MGKADGYTTTNGFWRFENSLQKLNCLWKYVRYCSDTGKKQKLNNNQIGLSFHLTKKLSRSKRDINSTSNTKEWKNNTIFSCKYLLINSSATTKRIMYLAAEKKQLFPVVILPWCYLTSIKIDLRIDSTRFNHLELLWSNWQQLMAIKGNRTHMLYEW